MSGWINATHALQVTDGQNSTSNNAVLLWGRLGGRHHVSLISTEHSDFCSRALLFFFKDLYIRKLQRWNPSNKQGHTQVLTPQSMFLIIYLFPPGKDLQPKCSSSGLCNVPQVAGRDAADECCTLPKWNCWDLKRTKKKKSSIPIIALWMWAFTNRGTLSIQHFNLNIRFSTLTM